jgi:hypothetical protein
MLLNKAHQIEWMVFGFTDMMVLINTHVGKRILASALYMGMVSSVNSVSFYCLTCLLQMSILMLMSSYLFCGVYFIGLLIKVFD